MTSSGMTSNLEHLQKKRQIKNTVGCLVTLIAPITLCAILLWIPQFYNNWQLHRFASNLYNYALPPQTEVISRYEEVGLMGNGNHCDYVAKQTMRTRLAKNEVEAYYAEVSLPPVYPNIEGVERVFRGEPIPVFVNFDNSRLENGWLHFTIELWDYGYSAGLDLRCH
jgi:hypothetical protein